MLLKNAMHFPLLLVLMCTFPRCVALVEPVTGLTFLGGALLSGFLASFNSIRCQLKECCTDKWVRLNVTELSLALDKRLHGQHLVKNAVLKHIKAHLNAENPSKALALSFHGGTGTGKNHVSRIIAEHVYKRGMKSQFVHILPSTKEFPHEEMVPLYKMDKMPPGLIDTVKPYLDFYEQLDGVNYRKAIFIFLSNTAGKEISRHTLDHWHTGKKREDIKLSDMERIVTTAAVNTKDSGLWHSDLLIRHMISAYIPFLPLERRHIKQCVKDNLLEKKFYKNEKEINAEKVQEIVNELTYYPQDEQLFSVTGCKRVPEKVDFIMEDLDLSLDNNLFGQHLVKNVVVKHLKAHLNAKNPPKALALSFHGTSGTGKNYVSKIIAEHVFRLGMRSKFVHILPSTKVFQLEHLVPQYKEQFKDLIERSTATCERSMFIFDEMDKMPPGLIDVVKPYLDFYEQLDGIDYRKAIFLFLSNTAAEEISSHTLAQLKAGKQREDIVLSGLWHSNLFTKHMISAAVPFLPLERHHIKQCIRDKLVEKKIYKHRNLIGEDKLQEVLNELSFYPEDEKLFSVTGCKRVSEKVDYKLVHICQSILKRKLR
ncbi:hypothetical protein KUTeg_024014, partial [Tegillarca granosa]